MDRVRFLRTTVAIGAILGSTLAALPAPANVKPIGIFGDNMVLQRGMKTPVWGAADLSAVGYFFARDIQKVLNVPVGLIVTGGVAETLVPMEVLQGDPGLRSILDRWAAELAKWPQRQPAYDAQVKEWEEAVKKVKAEGKRPPSEPNPPANSNYWRRPAGLYNGAIAPMIPYGIRGVVTYVERPLVYESRKLLPAVVNSWRGKWGQGDFPFLTCQAANYWSANPQPAESTLAEFREAQLLTVLTVPNTALAATIDIGDAVDLHPRNKQADTEYPAERNPR